jgi:hypothetical protein
MHRARRFILGTLTLVSLSICIATIAFWIRSYSGSDYISRRWRVSADSFSISHDSHEIQWTRGQIRFQLVHHTYYHNGQLPEITLTPGNAQPRWSTGRLGANHIGWESATPRSIWNRLGFTSWQTGWSSSFADVITHVWAIPAWFVVLLTAVLPALWGLRRLRQRRRYARGLCAECGYDLRATPERCPECGAAGNGVRGSASMAKTP